MKHLFKITFLVACLLGVVNASGQGIEAGSWGGKVRKGPGVDFAQVGSLRNGDPVRLLEDTRVMMNGYPWHRISYQGGKIGYQWGGILCGFDTPIDGVHKICEADNRRRASARTPSARTQRVPSQNPQKLSCSAESKERSIKGDTPVQISFRAVGENDETQFKIYWLDYQGRRKFYKHIFAGDLFKQSTFMTHPWLVTAPVPGGGEDCVAIYLPKRNAQIIVLR